MTVTASRTWADLSAHRLEIEKLHLRDFFARDPQRAGALSLSFEDILYDFSKQRLTPETIGLLVALASEAFALHSGGAGIKRVIIVPGRLVNVVI